MNIFSNLKVYSAKYKIKSRRMFTAEEIAAVKEAVVVEGRYGATIQFTMIEGGLTFIPLDRDSSLSVGEVVDLSKAEIIILSKSGEADITRIF